MPEEFFIYFVLPAMIIVYAITVDPLFGGHINRKLSHSFIVRFLDDHIIIAGPVSLIFLILSWTIPIMLLWLIFDDSFFAGLGFVIGWLIRLSIGLSLFIYIVGIYDQFNKKT